MTALVIHGHFYQPPRESPWTEAIERQDGAAPHHDWNERIHQECYRSNAFSRIVDGYQRIERILNNYELISFNFGPTLLSWMSKEHPETYRRIVEADRKSARAREGHGNAIAQGYNHSILPLATPRDRRTQIRWGLYDFKHRFGRDTEGLWLPETAADEATLDALIEEGVRFTILSPHQAARVRALDGRSRSRASGPATGRPQSAVPSSTWRDVSDGSIDPTQAYRYSHRDGSGRHLALFFYDGGIAHSVAFEGVLHSSQGLIEKMSRAAHGPLVNVATDGETYGHHFHFGDRTLAYALLVEAPRQGLTLTNYARFLAEHPPRLEVEIKKGGTAWSCAHGLGRWSGDCGCHTGGREGWNQAWRGPLRAALDQLRGEADALFESAGGELFQDPWAMRDAYIEAILEPSKTAEVLARHARRNLDGASGVRARTLLELQRSAQLMYTSCGWFFSDPTGIETIQILRYAARALELMGQLGAAEGADQRFIERLGEGRSNRSEAGTIADLFRGEALAVKVDPPRVALHVAIAGLLDPERAPDGTAGGFRYKTDQLRRAQHGRISFLAGRVDLESEKTGRADVLGVSALHFGGADFFCAVRPVSDRGAFAEKIDLLFQRFPGASLPAILRGVEEVFGGEQFGLEQVLAEERERIGERVVGDLVSRFSKEYDALYDDHWRMFELLKDGGFDLPLELRAAAEITLGRRLLRALKRAYPSPDPIAYQEALAVAEQIKSRKLSVDLTVPARLMGDLIHDVIVQAIEGRAGFEAAIGLLDLADRLGLKAKLNLARAQEKLYLAERRALPREMVELARLLGFTPEAFSGG